MRFPYIIAIADTVERLLSSKAITHSEKDNITDLRVGNIFPFNDESEMLSDAPDGFERVLELLFTHNLISTTQYEDALNRVQNKTYPFESPSWCLSVCSSQHTDKGRLSRRTLKFLTYGSMDSSWHQEFILAVKDLKAQLYTQEEAIEVLEQITGRLDRNDLQQINYGYSNDRFEMSHRR